MSTLKLTWDANGSIESFSVFKSSEPIDLANLPKPIATGLTAKEFIDSDVVDGETYYYRVASISGQQQKISDEVIIVAQGTDLTATVFTSSAYGRAEPNAEITVQVNEGFSAEFTQQANQIQGKAQANATITIQIEE